jgi:signal transduction histidine kinase
MRRASLTWKTTWRFAALVTATTALVLAAGGWLLDQQMRRGLSLLHEGEARELAGFLRGAAATPEAVRARVLRDSEGDAEWFFIQIHDGAGRVLFRSSNLGQAILPGLGEAGEAERRRVVELPGVGWVLLSEVVEDGWRIQVGSPMTVARLLLADYARVSAGLVAGAAVIALGLGYGFSRLTLRPLRVIAETARRIGGDNLRERVPEPGASGEPAELARVLNQTFDRLEASFEQVRRFAADASHELKTPLALMRLNAERLRARAAGGGEESGVDELIEAIGRMQTVIERLLFIARAEGGGLRVQAERVEVAGLVADFAEDAVALLEDAGGRFVVAGCDEGELRGDGALLRQLLLNLVANAARVSPVGGVVTLEARRVRGPGEAGWRLEVRDEGPGLPGEQLERVFGRFVRFEPPPAGAGAGAGAELQHGHGLGLAICRSIAQLHGGTIRAENRRDGRSGLGVVVELPGGHGIAGADSAR